MYFVELNIVGSTAICLPIGSFIFWPSNEGGSMVRLLKGKGDPFLVDESYEYIIDVLTTCAGVRVHRTPEDDE
jgi:hypothetical protein